MKRYLGIDLSRNTILTNFDDMTSLEELIKNCEDTL